MVNNKAFTLIELLIVMAIIGILAVGGFGSYVKSQQRGRDAKRKIDLKKVQNCMEQYYLVNATPYQYQTLTVGPLTNAVTIQCGDSKTISVQDPTNPTSNYSVTASTISGFTITATLESEVPNTFTISNQQ